MKFLLPIILLLSSCSHTMPMTLPNGEEGYTVNCPGELEKCQEEARRACPKGYYDIEHNENLDKADYDIKHNLVDKNKTEAYIVGMMFSCKK